MALLRERLGPRVVSSADLERLEHGRRVQIGGLVVARQRPGTASGVVFILLEDEFGTINLVVPPPVYERHRLTVRTEPLMLVEGKLEKLAAAGGAINVLVDSVGSIDAPDRVLAEIKDFSMLDEQVRRGLAEQKAAAGAGNGRAERSRGRRCRGGFSSGRTAGDELRLRAAAVTARCRDRAVRRPGAIRCRPHGHRRCSRHRPDLRPAAVVGPQPRSLQSCRPDGRGRWARLEHGCGGSVRVCHARARDRAAARDSSTATTPTLATRSAASSSPPTPRAAGRCSASTAPSATRWRPPTRSARSDPTWTCSSRRRPWCCT